MKQGLSLGRPKPTILAILSAILLSLFAVILLAPSVQAKTWGEMTLDEQILSYTYYYAVSECLGAKTTTT